MPDYLITVHLETPMVTVTAESPEAAERLFYETHPMDHFGPAIEYVSVHPKPTPDEIAAYERLDASLAGRRTTHEA